MNSERQLSAEEYSVCVDYATSLSDHVRKRELHVDKIVPKTLAAWRKKPLRTEVSSKTNSELFTNMTSLEKICFERECLTYQECQKVPRLIRRIRDLLLLHYDIMHGIRENLFSDYRFCLPEDYADLAHRLHAVGAFLRMQPTRLFDIIRLNGQEMIDIMFEETMCLSIPHAESAKESRSLQSSRRYVVTPPRLSSRQTLAMCHRASAKYLLLVSQLWMCVAQDSPNDVHRQLAWNRLVDFSSKNTEIPAFADAMSYILHPEMLGSGLTTFLKNDGIQSFVFSWITNWRASLLSPHATILEKIDLDIWRNQSEDGIRNIMSILLTKLEAISAPDAEEAKLGSQNIDDLTPMPLFRSILHTIYSVFGLDPFTFAAASARFSVLFQCLASRIRKHPQHYLDKEQFERLVDKCGRLTTGTINRYMWLSCAYQARKQALETASCDNALCRHKQRIRAWFKSGRDMSEEQERMLDRWGEAMKLCAGCRNVLYCCKECQREGWASHKSYCSQGESLTPGNAKGEVDSN